MQNLRAGVVAVCAVAFTAVPGWAGNGLNLIGFGIESNLLAGADVAMARDTGALNTNPAGLSRIERNALDFHFGFGYPLGMHHRDQVSGDVKADNPIIPLANFALARRLTDSRLTLGFGTFAQGGAGNRYMHVNNVFGTRDELSSAFRIAKLVPGLAYQVSERSFLGVALPVSVADFRQKLFPQTSVFNPGNPAQSFFGTKLTKALGVSAGLRLGAQYRVNDAVTLGLSYAPKNKLDLENGELRVNMSALGLGEVKYGDATVKGLALAQEVGLGIAWRASENLQLSTKLAWLDWSSALKSNTVTAIKPDNPAAPPSVVNTISLDWRDQYVVALGASYRWDKRTALWGGYNYGRNPIPERTSNPLLGTFGEHHVVLGVTRSLGDHWQFATALEYDVKASMPSNNPELPFGPGAHETGELLAFHFGLSRRW